MVGQVGACSGVGQVVVSSVPAPSAVGALALAPVVVVWWAVVVCLDPGGV